MKVCCNRNHGRPAPVEKLALQRPFKPVIRRFDSDPEHFGSNLLYVLNRDNMVECHIKTPRNNVRLNAVTMKTTKTNIVNLPKGHAERYEIKFGT